MIGSRFLLIGFAALCVLATEASARDGGQPYHRDFNVLWWTPIEPGSIPDPDTAIVTSNGRLLAVTDSGHPMAIDIQSGMQSWISAANAVLGIAPVECGGGAAFAGPGGTVVYVRDDGSVGWTTKLATSCERLACDGERILVSSGSTLWTLEALNGSIIWETELGSAVAGLEAIRGQCVVSTGDGSIIAIDSALGTIRWQFDASASISDRLMLDPTAVYAVSDNGVAWSLWLDSGHVRWRRPLASGAAPLPRSLDGAPLFRSGDLLFIAGRGLYGLRVLSCSTGEVLAIESLPSAPYRRGFGDAGAVGFFWIPHSGGDVLVFDLYRRCLIKRLSLPDDPELIGIWEGRLILTTGDAIFALRALPSVRTNEIGRSEVAAAVRGTLWSAWLIMALLVMAAIIAVRAGSSLAPTSLVRIRFWFTSLAALSICCVCVWAATVFAHAAVRQLDRLESLWFAVTLLGPPAGLAWSFLRPLLFAPRPAISDARRCGRTVPGLLSTLRLLRREMGISQSVAIIAADTDGPVVTYSRCARPTLIVPSDLSRIVMRAAGGDPVLARSLLRFVLAHELAHVLHRDLWVLPLSHAFQLSRHAAGGSVKAAIIVVVSFIGIRLLNPTGTVATLGPPVVVLLGAATAVLGLTTRLLLAEREQLADAAATIRVDSTQLLRLTAGTGSGSEGLPPLGQFAVSVRAHGSFAPSYLGFAVQSPARQRHPLLSTYRRLAGTAERRGLLLSSASEFGTSGISIVCGASLGLLVFLAMYSVWLYGFGHVLVAQSPAGGGGLLNGYLDAMAVFSRWAGRADDWVHSVRTLGIAACGFFMAALVLLPLGSSVRGEPLPRHWRALEAGVQSLLCALLFLALVGVFQDWLRFRRGPLFPALRFSSGAVAVWLFVTAVVHCVFAATAGFADRRSAWHISQETALVLVGVTVSIGSSYVFLQGLESLERVPWAFVISALAFLMAVGTPVRRLAGFQYLGDERTWVAWVGGLRCVRTPMRLEPTRVKERAVFVGVCSASLFVFIASSALASSVVGPWLLRQNIEFYEGRFQQALVEPDSISNLCIRTYMRPGRASPAVVGGIASSVLVLLLLLAALVASSFSRARRVARTIRQTAAMVRIQDLLGEQLVTVEMADRVGRHVTKIARRRRLSSRPPYHTLWCRLACDAHICGAANGMRCTSAELAVFTGFVAACAGRGGGYAAQPGASPDIWHTALAIAAFGVDLNRSESHVGYLSEQVDELLRSHTKMCAEEWLEMMSLVARALASLERTASPALNDRKAVTRTTLRVWERSRATIADTAAALEILGNMSPKADTSACAMIERHVASLDAWLSTVSPVRIEQAVNVVLALRACDPGGVRGRESVRRFREHLVLATTLADPIRKLVQALFLERWARETRRQ